MRIECIEELINSNREVEFRYHGRWYSITYYNDDREDYISVCEFYKTPIDVSSAKDVLSIKIGNYTLGEIFERLPDTEFIIY